VFIVVHKAASDYSVSKCWSAVTKFY